MNMLTERPTGITTLFFFLAERALLIFVLLFGGIGITLFFIGGPVWLIILLGIFCLICLVLLIKAIRY